LRVAVGRGRAVVRDGTGVVGAAEGEPEPPHAVSARSERTA
jgi:hypothetical protein